MVNRWARGWSVAARVVAASQTCPFGGAQAAQAKWQQLEVSDEALSSLAAIGFPTAQVPPVHTS